MLENEWPLIIAFYLKLLLTRKLLKDHSSGVIAEQIMKQKIIQYNLEKFQYFLYQGDNKNFWICS